MQNLLLEPIDYQVTETRLGVWRRFLYPTGELFEEFVAHRRLFGLPLLHYTYGKCPENGRRRTARGVVAVGRRAVGVVAVGQMAIGVIAIGQLAVGALLGIGQASVGFLSLGQLALGALVGIGQAALGYVAVGQFGFGHYVLAQLGFGDNIWDVRQASPVAQQFFKAFLP